ncbi:MAG: type IV pilus biogenesis protein PilM [Planctomycetota bacterium]|jgi:type II secretory pathway component PulL
MRSTGIYFSNGTIRVAEVAGSRRRPELKQVAVAPVPETAEAGEVLAEMLREAEITPARACVSLPGEGAVVRRLRLPVSNPRAASKAVRFQAEEILCGDSLENVVVEHEVVGPAPEGGTEVLALIVRKAEIARALSTLARAGLEGVDVTLDAVALFNLAVASKVLPGEGRAAVLDFDGSMLRILVTKAGKLEVYRGVRLASEGGAGLGEEVVRELQRTMAGADIQDPLEKILVTGEKGEEGLQALSGQSFAPVERLDPGMVLGGREVEKAAVSAVAAGAALKGLGAEALAVNFRKDEFAPKEEWKRVFFLGMYAAGALAILFGILFAGSVRRLNLASKELNRLTREEEKYWKKVFPKKKFPRVGFSKHILNLKKKPASGAPVASRYASFLEALRKISNASPGEGLQVQAISFDQQKIVLAGEVDSMERFERLTQNLQARFGVRIRPNLERRRRGGGQVRTLFRIEIPRPKEIQ